MRLFDKLFQRTHESAPPAPTNTPVPIDPAADADDPGSIGPAAAAETPVASPAPPTGDPVPLRSLTRYQYDPAFAQFQQKLHRPRGLPAPRPRLRPDEYPSRPPKSPA